MTSYRETIKKWIPEAMRDAMRPKVQRYFFSRGVRAFLALPDGNHVPPRVFSRLVYGWGNAGFSAREEYMQAFLRAAENASGPILECGSGLSSVLLGLVAQRHGNRVWSLEHHDGWANRVRGTLDEFNISSVELCVSPLRDYGDYAWYDPPWEGLPDDFALVVCDGPPKDTRGGRFGMLPIMRQRLAAGCIILLDDAQREDERRTADLWAQELGSTVEIHGSHKPYALVRLPKSPNGQGKSASKSRNK